MTLPMLAQLQILLFATPALVGWALLPFALPASLTAPAAIMLVELAAPPVAVQARSVSVPRRAITVCPRVAVHIDALVRPIGSRVLDLLPRACAFPQAPRAP